MTAPTVTPSQVRCALLLRDEIALLDVRHEAAYATGHPLFAANMAADSTAVLDVGRFDEYATMNMPGSISVPGAELVLRAGRAAPDPETTIIVNCAGRTRSIIGTQSLINAGVANKVLALRNGTIGWTLAGEDLEPGADRRGEIGPVG